MTKNLTQKEMFDLSVEKWGVGSQLNMLAEESTELATAALHLNRNNKDKTLSLLNLAEEIADVQFMIDEFLYIFKNTPLDGSTFFNRVIEFRKMKEYRLSNLLQSNENKPTEEKTNE